MKIHQYSVIAGLLFSSHFCFSQQANLSNETFWAVKGSDGSYVINNRSGKTLTVFFGNSPGDINWKKSEKIEHNKTLPISASPLERKFFATVTSSDTLIVTERHVPMQGTPNLRDLGGLPAAQGRRVKWGLIYRSGALDKLSASDLEYWKLLQIRAVVDFRNDTEIQNAPDKYPDNYNVKYVRAQIGISRKEDSSKRFMEILRSDTTSEATARKMMIDANKTMASNIKDFKPLFDELIATSGNHSLLFHCSAGKDRTGLASALILSVLGVPEDIILEEYQLTNQYFKPHALKNGTLNQFNPVVSSIVMSAEPEYIKAALTEIKGKYGSVDNCLEQEIGLDKKRRQLLINAYTH